MKGVVWAADEWRQWERGAWMEGNLWIMKSSYLVRREIKVAMKEMNTGKADGPDGIPVPV